jgi:hypothetical protein
MVRAAGLYPAGSRFESWLPYHHSRRTVAAPGPGADPASASGLADQVQDLLAAPGREATLGGQGGDPTGQLFR